MRNYLSNEQIYLRTPEPEDLEIMYQTENDTTLWEISSITVPYSRYILKEYITSSQHDFFIDRQLRLMIVNKVDNNIIGIIDLYDYHASHNRSAIGIIILEEFRKQGYARQAVQLVCEYAYSYLHLHQLYAYIPVDNLPSIKLFTSCGFTLTGTLKDWLQTDQGYKDTVFVQRIQ